MQTNRNRKTDGVTDRHRGQYRKNAGQAERKTGMQASICRDRQTERRSDRQAGRGGRQAYGQTDRQTDR